MPKVIDALRQIPQFSLYLNNLNPDEIKDIVGSLPLYLNIYSAVEKLRKKGLCNLITLSVLQTFPSKALDLSIAFGVLDRANRDIEDTQLLLFLFIKLAKKDFFNHLLSRELCKLTYPKRLIAILDQTRIESQDDFKEAVNLSYANPAIAYRAISLEKQYTQTTAILRELVEKLILSREREAQSQNVQAAILPQIEEDTFQRANTNPMSLDFILNKSEETATQNLVNRARLFSPVNAPINQPVKQESSTFSQRLK